LSFEIGNDELDAEHALGFDLAVRARGSRFESEVSFFRSDIENYIFRQPPATSRTRFRHPQHPG
jgi:hypothetical protein